MTLLQFIYLLNTKTNQLKQIQRCMSTIKRIERLLIANRGEIACRIMRTAKRLGIETVAVYSDADRHSMHVSQADHAYNIGPANSQQSYLCGSKLIDVAKKSQCQAIHPGYGFLSENTEFAELCQQNDVIFVGPPASAIRDMGIKSTSKAIMSAAGVPIVDGYHGEDQSIERLKLEAERIGFPVMIKAVRGGGGKGMRIANTDSEFLSALESAKNESLKSFGDDNVLLERYIREPRHVEVQIFADQHGNAVYLFERDCSVQRRHQKIIEEAPAPGISDVKRQELGVAAVRAAQAVNYVGAGTVEFILDRYSHSFHFMEMNTRLQVEHPITEMITGTDLVEWQLKIAAGERLPVQQSEIKLNGHAFEGRIYAEDPSNQFLPQSGQLVYLKTPQSAVDVRVETGVRQGDEVSVHYDPMIAKLVVWGENRAEALSKFAKQLINYNIAGIETNINFLLDLCKHSEFISGNVHTAFIDENKATLFVKRQLNTDLLIKLALSMILNERHHQLEHAQLINDINNPFVIETGFRVNYNLIRTLKFQFNQEPIEILVRYLSSEHYEICLNQNDANKEWISVDGIVNIQNDVSTLKYQWNGAVGHCKYVDLNDNITIFDENGQWKFLKYIPKYKNELIASVNGDNLNSDCAVAPMPGIIEKILVRPDDVVEANDPLFVQIAMKMEYVIKATRAGRIERVNCQVGDNVSKNTVVIEFQK